MIAKMTDAPLYLATILLPGAPVYAGSQTGAKTAGNFTAPPALRQLQNPPCLQPCFDFRHFMGMKSKPWSF